MSPKYVWWVLAMGGGGIPFDTAVGEWGDEGPSRRLKSGGAGWHCAGQPPRFILHVQDNPPSSMEYVLPSASTCTYHPFGVPCVARLPSSPCACDGETATQPSANRPHKHPPILPLIHQYQPNWVTPFQTSRGHQLPAPKFKFKINTSWNIFIRLWPGKLCCLVAFRTRKQKQRFNRLSQRRIR